MTLPPAIAALAASGLPGAPSLARTGWGPLVAEVADHGLSGLLDDARRLGRVRLDAETTSHLDEQLVAEATQAVMIEGELIRLQPLVAAAGVALLDGPVFAHHAYADPQLRPLTGIDLLVAEADAPRTTAALLGFGYRPDPSPGAQGPSMLHHEGGISVVLHTTLPGEEARGDVSALLADRRVVPIGPVSVSTLSWEAHLLVAALVASATPGTNPLLIRDVAQIAAHPGLDLDAAIALAERWDANDVIVTALQRTVDELHLDLEVEARPPLPRPASTTEPTTIDRDAPAMVLAPVPPRLPAPTPSVGRDPRSTMAGLRVPPAPQILESARTVPPLPPIRRPDGPRSDRVTRQGAWADARPPRLAATVPGPASDVLDAPPGATVPPTGPSGPVHHGVAWAVTGAGLILLTILSAQLGGPSVGSLFVPLGGLLLAVAAARHITRTRPDEAWVGRWLILGVVAKMTASYFRYLTLVIGYEGVGDATGYVNFGRRFARAWRGMGEPPQLTDFRETNFLRYFTGIVYYVFGENMLTGYFVFGLLAFVGSYCWYRAAADSVPSLNKKLFFGLMMFAPSIVFWPSSIGKESLMQLGIGVLALGTSLVLRQRLLAGLTAGLAGGWMMWVIRPHLLAGITVAAAFAYFVGRVRAGDRGFRSFLARPAGIVVMAVLLSFAVTQGAEFLGLDEISVTSVEAELDAQTERSAQGGSEYQTQGSALNPLNLPMAAVNVLIRPFAWETDSALQLIAALESTILAIFLVVRIPSLRTAFVRARSSPFLLYCWTLTLIYITAFSSFANFGLLVRQRSLVLPAVLVLVSVSPVRDRLQRTRKRSHTPDPEPELVDA